MTENNWNTSVLRSLTHSLQMPHIDDLRVMTYANIVQSVIPELPEDFYVEDVEVLLKKTYNFSNVSKLLISQALLVLSNQKGTSKEEITYFDKSTFTIQVDERTPFKELTELLIAKIAVHGLELDEYQIVLVENLLECTLFQMSEALDEVIARFYEGKSCLTEHILSDVVQNWREKLDSYGPGYIEKYEDISDIAIKALKILFTEKKKISVFLGIIGQILVYRGFICADPELKKLTKEIFSKTFLVIDTNVLIAYLCQGCLEHDEIIWLIDNCREFGMKVILLEGTKNEFERTLLKDNIRYSLLHAEGDADLNFGDRDIPMGYSRKWHKLGSWNKYIRYLEKGVDNFIKNLDAEIIKLDIENADYRLAYARVIESIRSDRYKDPKAIKHDARLILSSHLLREKVEDPPFPSFILTREKKLYKAEEALIEKDAILNFPSMVVSTDSMIEFLLPFFAQTEDPGKVQTILGKMLSNAIMGVDKRIIEYLLEYLSIETSLGKEGTQQIMELALDEHTSDNLMLMRESQSPVDSNTQFVSAIIEGLEKLDETSQLKEKLVKLTGLAKTPPPKSGTVPKMQKSMVAHISQLMKDKLPIFCTPKPKKEKELQREMNKLLRSHDYQPNYDRNQGTFSGVGARPDFSFKEDRIAIEAKYIGEKTTISEIVRQMAADTTQYSNDYDIIIFVVYDKFSNIPDIDVFSSGFEEKGNIVIVI